MLMFLFGVLLNSSGLQQRSLPERVRSELTRAYPGWRFATLMPALQPAVTAVHGSMWISGDFDGDGRRDYAVQIQRPAPKDSAELLVALLRRGGGFRHFVLDASAHRGLSNTYLLLARRGERVMNLDADPNGDSSMVLRRDAVMMLYGEAASQTCVYERGRFRCFISGD